MVFSSLLGIALCALLMTPLPHGGAVNAGAVTCDVDRFDCGATSDSTLNGKRYVDAAYVLDGVCDCCSGLDEAPGTCPDTCSAESEAAKKILQQYVIDSERGAIRASRATVNSERLAKLLQDKRDAFHAAESRASAAEALIQAEGKSLKTHISTDKRQQILKDAEEQRTQAELLRAQSTVDYGPNKRYLSLLTDPSCAVSPALSEKLTKGGSAMSAVSRGFVYVYCAYRDVSVLQVDPDGWTREERAAMGRHAEAQAEEVLVTVDDNAELPTNASTCAACAADGGSEAVVASIGPANGQVTVPALVISRASEHRRRAQLRNTDRPVGPPLRLGTFAGYLLLSSLDQHVWAALGDNPSALGTPPQLTMTLPPVESSLLANRHASSSSSSTTGERDLAAVAHVFTSNQRCVNSGMSVPRRTYVFHVCSGHSPHSMRMAREAVRLAASSLSSSTGENSASVTGWASQPLPQRYLPSSHHWNADRPSQLHANVTLPALAALLGMTSNNADNDNRRPSFSPSQLGRVVHVEEDGLCTLRVFVATPLACSTQKARDVRAAIDGRSL